MSRHVHKSERTVRRRVPIALGALVLVVAMGIALVAEVRLSGNDGQPVVSGGDLAGAAAADLSGTADSASIGPGIGTRDVSLRQLEARGAAKQAAAAKKQAEQEKAEALARKATQKAKERRQRQAATAPFDLTIGSFNVLGSQHTVPGGDRSHFAPASVRSVAAASLIARHGVDIVGTQELQADQLAALQSRTGMAAYPGMAWGSAETDNSVLYDSSRFSLVSGSKFTIPFMGRPRPQPILRLKELATGREFYVINTHPSAHDGRYLVERRQGQAALVSLVNQLKQTGLPVFVTGDMNDREEFYCNVVPAAGLTAPNGGSYSSGCQPPPGSIPVDWVVGAGNLSWSGYWRDTSPVTNRTSDHFFISATAHVG